MVLNKKDFIEIDFTGRVKEGEIFDSTVKEDLEKMHEGHDHEILAKPFIFCLGEGMFLKAVEDLLIGKPETPATYEIELKPEEAFGKRNLDLVQMIPMKVFTENRMTPVPGAMFNFDGKIGKTIAVSAGRVMVDFNNPLAGKTVEYKIEVRRKVTDNREKIKALNEFLFRKDLDFTVDNMKIVLKVEKEMKPFVEMFKDKFKDILGLELEVEEAKEVKQIAEKKGNSA